MIFSFRLTAFVVHLILLVYLCWSFQWRLLCLVGVCLLLGWGFDLYLLIVEDSRWPGFGLFLDLLRPRTLVRGRIYGLFWRSVRFLFFSLWWSFRWAFYVTQRVLGILCMMQDTRSFCNLHSRFSLCLLRLLFLCYTRLVRAGECILHSSNLGYSFSLCDLFFLMCGIE